MSDLLTTYIKYIVLKITSFLKQYNVKASIKLTLNNILLDLHRVKTSSIQEFLVIPNAISLYTDGRQKLKF